MKGIRHFIEQSGSGIGFMLVAALFVLASLLQGSLEERGVLGLIFLFLLPLVNAVFVRHYMAQSWRRFRWLLDASWLYLVLWVGYSSSVKYGWDQPLLLVAAISCGLLVGASFVVIGRFTFLLIKGSRTVGGNDAAANFYQDFHDHPLLTITSFLTLFICVVFYLSFALAFYDGYEESLLPVVTNRQSSVVASASLSSTVPEPPQRTVDEEGLDAMRSPFVTRLWFEEGQADLDLERRNGVPEDKDCFGSIRGDFDKLRACLNRVRIDALTEKIIDPNGLNNGYQRLRVIVLGHATDKPVVSHRYKSNYELSEARVHSVRLSLDRELQDKNEASSHQNLEWLLIPASDEELTLGTDDQGLPEGFDDDPSAEVAVTAVPNHITELEMNNLLANRVEPGDLGLIDYVYFIVYTATTTGYGDLVPISAVAKFITIVGNLFEVSFMVVFLGVVVGLCKD